MALPRKKRYEKTKPDIFYALYYNEDRTKSPKRVLECCREQFILSRYLLFLVRMLCMVKLPLATEINVNIKPLE